MIARYSISTLCILISSLMTHAGQAKGLDEIQPRTEEQKQADKKPVASSAPAAATATPAQAAAAGTSTATTTITKGALSTALEDKLSLGLSLGYAKIPHAKAGTFDAYGATDFSLGYRYYDFASGRSSLRATFRYLPIHSENRIDGESFKSIIEGYYLGTAMDWLLTQSLSVFGGIELGYLLVYMESRDRFPVSDSSESNEFAAALGTGLDWFATQKVKVGPRINVAFGAYQIVQFAGAVTLSF